MFWKAAKLSMPWEATPPSMGHTGAFWVLSWDLLKARWGLQETSKSKSHDCLWEVRTGAAREA